MTVQERPQRPQRPQIVLEVIERIRLTPHLVRIVAGGPGMSAVEDNGFADAYTKMLFAPAEAGITPPYDMDRLREELPIELLPTRRTYSIRRFDLDAGRIWIDFVTHGDEGIAGPWAANAKPGDPVVLGGIGGGYAPDAAADWHLLVGDESAIPAISSALEAMPADAAGIALLEVQDESEQLELTAPAGVELRWLHRGEKTAGTTDLLVDAVRALEWQPGRVQVFAHGERGAMKQLRPHLTDERGVDRTQLSLSAYWAYGRREDAFQAEKREAVGQI
ncbi:siderophore-interacting protein [Microbacterium aerolatum]|uniref:Siderophore-interacting protein n=1 Tax=Microbacterium aerolatum TaxID=153731 RepID=A0A511ABL2_9MICO|nr:siderophore-interacting protein [Microbacterium aerolatum]GEK85568.1 siderophore-interacting protein [Microbacterium aerolatum]GGB32098.1 siderophore-interacting protein [Microbacterium aerolatum]